MSREDLEGSIPPAMRRGKNDDTDKMNELWKMFEKRMQRILKEAVLEERETCANIALWRTNLYDDLGQKNACKEIYSSIINRA